MDVYRRWVRPDASDAQSLRVGRYVTLFWGVTATFTALFFAGGGSIIEMINRVGSWFYGSLLGIFVMALFFRRAGDLAGALGLCGGMAAVVLVHNTVKVQFLWYNVVGLAGVLVVGGLTALAAKRSRMLVSFVRACLQKKGVFSFKSIAKRVWDINVLFTSLLAISC